MSARTERKRKTALVEKRYAAKLERQTGAILRFDGVDVRGLKSWTAVANPFLPATMQHTAAYDYKGWRDEQIVQAQQKVAERAIIAASVPRKNYVYRYHRRTEWNAYRNTLAYDLDVAMFRDQLQATQRMVSDALGIPNLDEQFDEIFDEPRSHVIGWEEDRELSGSYIPA